MTEGSWRALFAEEVAELIVMCDQLQLPPRQRAREARALYRCIMRRHGYDDRSGTYPWRIYRDELAVQSGTLRGRMLRRNHPLLEYRRAELDGQLRFRLEGL